MSYAHSEPSQAEEGAQQHLLGELWDKNNPKNC